VGGERLIDRVARALRAAADELLLVANDPASDVWLPGVARVADRRPGLGPLAGIETALAHGGTDVLVVAWDMPFVAPALLQALRALGGEGYDAVVPESDTGRLEPTCALYTQRCRPALERWLDAGRRGASDFLASCPRVRALPLSEVARFGEPERLFFSVNTADALERADLIAVRA
jgi:molybdopterin-guanine dinucleotide biosynthesis protein A